LSTLLLAFDDLELIGEASSGQAAVNKRVESHPDVVLMDLIMPGMDGAQTTRIITSSLMRDGRFPGAACVARS
jgi:NarL family two-component system response regulator LiaR